MPISQRTPPPKDQSLRGDSPTPPELRSSSLSSFEDEGATTPTKNVTNNKLGNNAKKVQEQNTNGSSTMGTAWRKVCETISSVSSFSSKEGDETAELDTSMEYDLDMTDVWLTEDSVECVLGAI